MAFRRDTAAVRTGAIEVLHCDDVGRLLAFVRRDALALVVGSLASAAYDRPRHMPTHPAFVGDGWQECLTDVAEDGGDGIDDLGRRPRASTEGSTSWCRPTASSSPVVPEAARGRTVTASL